MTDLELFIVAHRFFTRARFIYILPKIKKTVYFVLYDTTTVDYNIKIMLYTTIAAKVIISGFEHASRVLEAHSFQYFESEISKATEREIISEIVVRAPPCLIISNGKLGWVFEIIAIIPIIP